MQREGILIVVSGFSGVGKGTLTRELIRRYPDLYALSVSVTSRQPRKGEEEGVHYFFKTREAFEEMIRKDELIEHAEYGGNYYGTPKEYVLKEMSSGRNVILEIEVQGGLQIKGKFPETELVYVLPPDAGQLFERLVGRGTEDRETIMKRMRRAVDECDFISRYDTIITNDDFETCLNELHERLMQRQKNINKNHEQISTLKEGLIRITKGE